MLLVNKLTIDKQTFWNDIRDAVFEEYHIIIGRYSYVCLQKFIWCVCVWLSEANNIMVMDIHNGGVNDLSEINTWIEKCENVCKLCVNFEYI